MGYMWELHLFGEFRCFLVIQHWPWLRCFITYVNNFSSGEGFYSLEE